MAAGGEEVALLGFEMEAGEEDEGCEGEDEDEASGLASGFD